MPLLHTLAKIDIMQDSNKVVVRFDGSRPACLVKNGVPEFLFDTEPEWNNYFNPCTNALLNAIACTGRIDHKGKHIGTGFLIGGNLIVTNRHVLQDIAVLRKKWMFYDGVEIDFGREADGGRQSYLPRRLKSVVYTSPDTISSIDHNKADIALIEIEGDPSPLQVPLSVTLSGIYPVGLKIFLIGYPNRQPDEDEDDNPIAAIFGNSTNCKRISPGNVIKGSEPEFSGRLCHDASSLKGSSGSLIVQAGKEDTAVALHYGGKSGADAENWAHSFTRFSDTGSGPTLLEYFKKYGVKIV